MRAVFIFNNGWLRWQCWHDWINWCLSIKGIRRSVRQRFSFAMTKRSLKLRQIRTGVIQRNCIRIQSVLSWFKSTTKRFIWRIIWLLPVKRNSWMRTKFFILRIFLTRTAMYGTINTTFLESFGYPAIEKKTNLDTVKKGEAIFYIFILVNKIFDCNFV